MDNEYYYYEEDGKLYRLHIERDDEPWNPRKDQDGNIGTMICCRDYGDEIVDVVKYIDNLLRENVKENSIINYVKKGRASNNLELKYDRHERMWQLWGDYYLWTPTKGIEHGIINDTDQSVDWLIDDIIDAMTVGDKMALLERNGYLFRPIAVYEHGPYCTIKIGSKYSFVDGRWDGSDVGFIFTTKVKVLETCGGYYKGDKFIKCTPKNWKEVANHALENEVEEYRMYIEGECYGYKVDEYIPSDDDWNEEIDSCWGYFSSKWGEDLAREIANDGVTTQPFISEADAESRMEKLRAIALEEEKERLIMEQADTIVCI